MSRKTSLETFRLITDNGLLSKWRAQVWKGLYKHGPCTANELFSKMKADGSIGAINQQANITPRLLELEEQGCTEKLSDRPCQITGNDVTVWQTTDDLPKKIAKAKINIAHQRKLVKRLTVRLRKESRKLFEMEEREAKKNQLNIFQF